MLEDKRLVRQLKYGSHTALRRIYQKYRSDLLRLAASLLTETVEAEDVVQDVFMSFLESCGQFRLTGSLRGYLVTCVANRARNCNRYRTRHPSVGLESLSEHVSGVKQPDQWLVQNDEFQRVCEAMHLLPYAQREVVALRLQGAMTFKEIAQQQKASVKTVLSRYQYGIEKLRSQLQERDE